MGTIILIVELERLYAVCFPDDLLEPETLRTAGALWTAVSRLRAPAPEPERGGHR